jgi:hypothetical protein
MERSGMRFRVGRHNPQLVYSMLDDEPSDRDALLATCFTPGSASEIVKALNQAVGGSTPGQPDDMYEQAYHGVQKALDYAIGTHEESGAGAGIVADAMLLAQRYVDLRAAVLAGEAGFRTVERLEDPERAEALLIRYERAVEALRPAEGSTPEDQLIDEVIADAGPREPLDDCPKPDPHGPHIVTLDQQAGVVQRCPGLRPPPEDEPVSVAPPVDALLERVERVAYFAHRAARAEIAADAVKAEQYNASYRIALGHVAADLRALWAAGVEEGRQQLEQAEKLAALHGYELGVEEGRRQAARAISEETATFCMDGIGRHLVEVCTKLAAGPTHD